MRPAPADAGFTLVELLVSLSLLAMAAILMSSGILTDQAALRRIEGHASAGDEVSAAQDLIRDRIEHLFAQTQFDRTGPYVDVQGAGDALDFLSTLSGRSAGKVQRLRLSLQPGGDLVLAPQDGGDGGPHDLRLLRRVQAIEMTYYGADAAGRLAWRSDWPRQSTPPRLVRIGLSFLEGDRRRWPELIVQPAATVDSACVLDLTTTLCRGRQ